MSLGDWLQEQLFERCIVVVTGRLEDDAVAKAAAALLALDARTDRRIELQLDSPDAVLGAALVLIDTIEMLRSLLRVTCRGLIGGPPIGVVAAADHCAESSAAGAALEALRAPGAAHGPTCRGDQIGRAWCRG